MYLWYYDSQRNGMNVDGMTSGFFAEYVFNCSKMLNFRERRNNPYPALILLILYPDSKCTTRQDLWNTPIEMRFYPHLGGSNWLSSKFFHVVLPYTSWRATFPSSVHQVTSRSIIPILSPFFVPGGSCSAAPGGGSAAKVTSVKCSSNEGSPVVELP